MNEIKAKLLLIENIKSMNNDPMFKFNSLTTEIIKSVFVNDKTDIFKEERELFNGAIINKLKENDFPLPNEINKIFNKIWSETINLNKYKWYYDNINSLIVYSIPIIYKLNEILNKIWVLYKLKTTNYIINFLNSSDEGI